MGNLHFLDVGCADATIITTDTATFLVDCHNIGDYSHLLPLTKKLRGVFITHQHYDHCSGLEHLRNKGYRVEFLIYSPYDRRYGDASVTIEEWNEFNDHVRYFEANGTKLFRHIGKMLGRHLTGTRTASNSGCWDRNGVLRPVTLENFTMPASYSVLILGLGNAHSPAMLRMPISQMSQ